jgi:hypothetical protein
VAAEHHAGCHMSRSCLPKATRLPAVKPARKAAPALAPLFKVGRTGLAFSPSWERCVCAEA